MGLGFPGKDHAPGLNFPPEYGDTLPNNTPEVEVLPDPLSQALQRAFPLNQMNTTSNQNLFPLNHLIPPRWIS